MRLKETTREQRLIALFVMALFVAYGFLTISHITAKFQAFCDSLDSPFGEENMILRFFVVLAGVGAGFICLHLWPEVKPRQREK